MTAGAGDGDGKVKPTKVFLKWWDRSSCFGFFYSPSDHEAVMKFAFRVWQMSRKAAKKEREMYQ